MQNNESMPHFQIIFEFLRYWGLWFNRNMENAFTFQSWGEKICCKVKIAFIAIDNLNHEERTLQGHISSHSQFELVCRVALSSSLEGFYTLW